MKQFSLGIDYAGLTTKKVALVEASLEENKKLQITVIYNHPLTLDSRKFKKIEDINRSFLKPLLKTRKNIYIDVPIDLQNLKYDTTVMYNWQLYKRPVDYVFNAIAPLGDNLGLMVASFRYLLLNSKKQNEERKDFANVDYLKLVGLGEKIFETYPKQSLKNLIPTPTTIKNYKEGIIVFDAVLNQFTERQEFSLDQSKKIFEQLNLDSKKKLLRILRSKEKIKKHLDSNYSENSIEHTKKIIFGIGTSEVEKNIKKNAKELKEEITKEYTKILNKKINIKKDEGLKEIFNQVFSGKIIKCSDKFHLNDDEFDAIICAMTGLFNQLKDESLKMYMKELDKDKCLAIIDEKDLVPEGYCLLAKGSLEKIELVEIKKCEWDQWILKNKLH